MFSNKICYTQSPGGIRRGLIWQSSDVVPQQETRNFIISPYSLSYGSYNVLRSNGKNMTVPADTYVADDNTTVGVQGIRPTYGNETIPTFTFPYITQVLTDPVTQQEYYNILADGYIRKFDIDLYVYPRVIKAFNSSGHPVDTVVETWYKSSDLSPVLVTFYNNVKQINQDGSGSATGYELLTPGNPSSNEPMLTYPMMSSPSLPMRIKGTFLFVDYPYAFAGENFSSRAQALNAMIAYDTITTQLSTMLANEPYPSDSIFSGSKINSPHRGTYIDGFNAIPTFQMTSGTRYDTTSGATSSQQKWAMTKGVHYDGLNSDFQFFFSPIAYPFSVYQGGRDSYCIIGKDQGLNYDELDFLKHEKPVFMSPIMNLPRANRVFLERLKQSPSPGAGNYAASLIPHVRPLEWTSGSYSHSGTATFWNNTNNPFNPYFVTNVGNDGVLMPYGLGYGSQRDIQTMIRFEQQTGAQVWRDESVIQPIFNRNELYSVEVCPEIAKHNYGVHTSTFQSSGRYKYAGFKGKVSFFEMP